MTRKDRTEGIYSRREVLDESERRQYNLIQLKDLLSLSVTRRAASLLRCRRR